MFEKIHTKTISLPSERGESMKAKLFIVLKRHENFAENMKKFNEVREENEKLKKQTEDHKEEK